MPGSLCALVSVHPGSGVLRRFPTLAPSRSGLGATTALFGTWLAAARLLLPLVPCLLQIHPRAALHHHKCRHKCFPGGHYRALSALSSVTICSFSADEAEYLDGLPCIPYLHRSIHSPTNATLRCRRSHSTCHFFLICTQSAHPATCVTNRSPLANLPNCRSVNLSVTA